MPLLHCTKCHHEWEGSVENNVCDWCGAAGYILQAKTALEKFIEKLFKKPA